MFGIENYYTFLFAGIILNLTPGADTIYIISRSAAQGRRAGIASVLGIMTGSMIHTTFAAVGLSMILATSALAYEIVKYAGAGYLIYLGIKMLVLKSGTFITQNELKEDRLIEIYRQGVLTNVLNPKVALFFLSFLPQFINPQYTKGPLPFLLLGLTFTTTGTIWCLIVAYSAASLTKQLRQNQILMKIMQKLCGVVFILLGLQLAIRK
jgi:threonine/homoserine/homoserine lactone efflux protein